MRSAINSQLDNYGIAGEINCARCRRIFKLIVGLSVCLPISLSVHQYVYHAWKPFSIWRGCISNCQCNNN